VAEDLTYVLVGNDMPLILVETSQQRGLLLTGLHLTSLDEKDQFSLPVFLGALSHDPNATRYLRVLGTVQIP
jgi:hypothetical protein